jgi:methoxymalonate biosynthesis protein
MGTGIAALACGHGLPVTLIDVNAARLEHAPRHIDQQVRHAHMMGALPVGLSPGSLTTSMSMHDAAHATAVVEAVTERPETKAKALAEVSAVIPVGIPLISNTSGIPIDEMAVHVARPDEFVGTHFMNPPYLIKTTEVARGARTSEATLQAVLPLLRALGREPIIVRDSPGFVTSRLLHPMINEAVRVVAEGVATAQDVDALMRGCLGHPIGPLQTADLIGLDNLVDALDALYARTGDSACRPSPLLRQLVSEGRLGCKSGHGFYQYGKDQT